MPNLLSSFSWSDVPNTAHQDRLAEDQRWSTWDSVERLCRGPEPWPDWLVTASAAIDTDLGLLKSGKEADVSLLERAVPDDPDRAVVLAAKRYRSTERRLFHRDTGYTTGRRVRNTRDTRAMARKSAYGRSVEADLWARAEWNALATLYSAGVPVPYPVQIDGTEIPIEFISDGGLRSSAASPDQAIDAPTQGALHAVVGRDAEDGRTWARARRPQPVPHVGRGTRRGGAAAHDHRRAAGCGPRVPNAFDFLHRDCTTMAAWFSRAGLVTDPDDLFETVLAHAW